MAFNPNLVQSISNMAGQAGFQTPLPRSPIQGPSRFVSPMGLPTPQMSMLPRPPAPQGPTNLMTGQPIKFSDITLPAQKLASWYFKPQITFGKALGYYARPYPWVKSQAEKDQIAYEQTTQGQSFQQQKAREIAQRSGMTPKLAGIIGQETAPMPEQPYTASEIAGAATGTALDFVGAGLLKPGMGAAKTIVRGAELGAGYGASEGLMQNQTGKELATSTAIGAGLGATFSLAALGAKGIANYFATRATLNRALNVSDDAQRILGKAPDETDPRIIQDALKDLQAQIEYRHKSNPELGTFLERLKTIETEPISTWSRAQKELTTGIEDQKLLTDITDHINTRKIYASDPDFVRQFTDRAGVDGDTLMKKPELDNTTSIPKPTTSAQALPEHPGTVEVPDTKQIKEILTDTSNMNMRRYAERVNEELDLIEKTDPRMKEMMYKTIKNVDLEQQARQAIRTDLSKAFAMAKNPTEAERPLATTIANLLLPELNKQNRIDDAVDLATITAKRLTTEGQSIQAASMFNKLTPEGIVIYTQRLLDAADKSGKGVKISKDAAQSLIDEATRLQGMAEGREKYLATQLLLKKIAEQVPPTIGQKLSEFQTLAMLLNPKTPLRNIIGNAALGGMENVSRQIAGGLDAMITAGRRVFGSGDAQRTVLGVTDMPSSMVSQAKGGLRGLAEGVQEANLGIRSSNTGAQFDLPKTSAFRGTIGKNLNKLLNYELAVPDKVFYQSAYDDSLRMQMKAAKVKEATDAMKEIAHGDALYRTLQDENYLSKAFVGLKRVLNGGKSFGLGDVVLKFPRTPANILKRGIEYSPLGFVETAFKLASDLRAGRMFNQKAFVEGAARAITGTGVVAAGAMLYQLGIITGKRAKDKDVRAIQEETGLGSYKVNLSALQRFLSSGLNPDEAKLQEGDKLVNYDWLQPTAIPISMGANLAENKAEKGEALSAIQLVTLLDAATAGANTIAEQPLTRGLQTLFGSNEMTGRTFVDALKDSVQSLPATFTPSVLNQARLLLDANKREVVSPNWGTEAMNMVKNRIPGLSSQLPSRISVTGEEAKYNLGQRTLAKVFNAFVNPAIFTTYTSTPENQLVLDIMTRSGETQQLPRVVDRYITVDGERVDLGPKTYQDYQTFVGRMTQKSLTDLLHNENFLMAPDEMKAKEISNILSDINTAAKFVVLGYHSNSEPSQRAQFFIDAGFRNADFYAPNLKSRLPQQPAVQQGGQ